ncbi:hypothetical protein ACHAXS_013628, partial [Conticribra weissflogii]
GHVHQKLLIRLRTISECVEGDWGCVRIVSFFNEDACEFDKIFRIRESSVGVSISEEENGADFVRVGNAVCHLTC